MYDEYTVFLENCGTKNGFLFNLLSGRHIMEIASKSGNDAKLVKKHLVFYV